MLRTILPAPARAAELGQQARAAERGQVPLADVDEGADYTQVVFSGGEGYTFFYL